MSIQIGSELDEEIGFQRKWRRITSFAYFSGASLSVITAAAATVVAGLGHSEAAAVTAAVATISTSLEKVLLFREKWTHHRAVETELDNLRLRYLSGAVDDAAAVEQMIRISGEYATRMPMAGGPPAAA